MLQNIEIRVNERIYLKDPESSELGRKMVEAGIALIDNIGFEAFTFKKLAVEIGSTEASIYRYFESKHRFLIYIACWYWRWLDYRLVLATTNIESPEERLKRAVQVLVDVVGVDSDFSHIDEVKLNRIIISESSKAYLNKLVDKENKEGFFLAYKTLVQRVSDIIIEVNPKYKYPHMLVSSIIEGAHHQRFFAEHLPRLTDVVDGEDAITQFSLQTIFNAIN